MKTLKDYVAKLKNDGLSVVNEFYEEPKEQGELWSTFAELEINFENVIDVLSFCFDSMPSTVEILEPDKLEIAALDLTNFLNDLQGRLHEADMEIKTLTAQQKVLHTNAMEVFRKHIVHLLSHGGQTSEELAEKVGLSVDDIGPFLKMFEEKKWVKNVNGTYQLGVEE